MKRYIIVFCALVFTTHQSNSIGSYPEIAINTQGKAVFTEDKQKTRCMFIPIMVYKNGKLICGTFIRWADISNAGDGNEIIDTYDSNNKRYIYRCNQQRASGNKTFKQALAEVVAKNFN